MTDTFVQPRGGAAPSHPAKRGFITDVLTLLELRADPARLQRPVSTPILDWSFVILSLMMTVGLWLDIWSHASFGPDQGVLNEFHMLFYSAAAMLGALLAFTHLSALRGTGMGAGQGQRIAWAHSLPQGYGLGALGLLIFGTAGVFDLASHALFGFETGFEATLSPSHIGLFVGWFLIGMTPACAALARRGLERLTLRRFLPSLIGITASLSSISTIVIYSVVIGGAAHATQVGRPSQDELGYLLSIMGQYIQTAILAGFVLWLARHFRLPAGSLTILYALYAAFLFVYSQDETVFPILLIAGVLTDAIYTLLLGPHPAHRLRLRLFGLLLPIVLWSIYYGYFIVTGTYGGVWFTSYVWIGSVFQAGFIGAFIAYFMTMSHGLLAFEGK